MISCARTALERSGRGELQRSHQRLWQGRGRGQTARDGRRKGEFGRAGFPKKNKLKSLPSTKAHVYNVYTKEYGEDGRSGEKLSRGGKFDLALRERQSVLFAGLLDGAREQRTKTAATTAGSGAGLLSISHCQEQRRQPNAPKAESWWCPLISKDHCLLQLNVTSPAKEDKCQVFCEIVLEVDKGQQLQQSEEEKEHVAHASHADQK